MKSRWDLLLDVSFSIALILLVAGGKYSWGIWGIIAAAVTVIPASGWLVWKLSDGNWLFLAAFTPALVLMMTYWTAALLETDAQLALLTLPLLTVLFVGILWAPLALWIWKIAKRRKDYRIYRISGPGMQAATMAIMFLPVISIAVFVPGMLELSQAWSTVSLAIAGILLSAVVSEPLRRFLLALGDLSPEPSGSTEQPQGNSGREE